MATHIIKIFHSGFGLNQLSMPVFILMAIAVFLEHKTFYGFSFLLMGIVCIISLTPSPSLQSALAPTLLFFISLMYSSKSISISIMTVSIPISFVLNFYIKERADFYNLPLAILVNYAVLFFLYSAVIKKKSDITLLSKITPLTPRQLLILKYICYDIKRKDMPKIVKDSELWNLDIERSGFTLDIINTEIAKIKSKTVLNINNAEALGVWYITQTEILEKEKQEIKENLINYRTNISNPFNKKKD
jgi:hypothetical protein